MKERSVDLLSSLIIAGAVLLCVVVSAVGFRHDRAAVEAAGSPIASSAAGDAQNGETPESGGLLEESQLSDPLLVLVNGETPLPEDWTVTPRMIDDEVVDLRMYDDLTAMFSAAAGDNVWFWVASGYRSVEEQEIILQRAVDENTALGMTEEDALTEALRTIQRPGYSEHHTGLAVDLNDVSDNFEDTDAYRWLSEHGAEFGFVQRYKKEKAEITGIDNESWHYRYVGREHAMEMERLGLCLEEYVAYLKGQGENRG